MIDPMHSQKIYAADYGSGVLFSDDHGESWSLITNGMGIKAIKCLSISPSGDVLYCGSEGGGVNRLALQNQAPNMYARMPISDTITIYMGDNMNFEILCKDLNNDTLEYTWWADGQIIPGKVDSAFRLNSLAYDLGYHSILVRTSDPDTTIETSWNLHIIALSSNNPAHQTGDVLKVYPNPFRNSVTAEYSLERSAHVQITVLDIHSRVVGFLCKQRQPAGKHRASWLLEGQDKAIYPAGVYIIRMMLEYDNLTLIQEKKIINMD